MVDALVNLLSNAYKYGGQPRKIIIRARHDEKAVASWCATTARASPATSTSASSRSSTGWTICSRASKRARASASSIVQHVMKAHRGKVEVDSEPGRGSTFTLCIPQPPHAMLALRTSEPLATRS
jgi:two-component system phosphate regulon sensor histidine kinase PhoR